MSQKLYDYLVKLLLIGDSGVGKTSILFRFSEDQFNTTFISTIGIDFKIRTIEVNGQKVKLQIWDTAGQERFATITTAYYRGAQGIILVYDITNNKTFERCQKWKQNIDTYGNQGVSIVLCGNKNDLMNRRDVLYDDGKKFADKYNMEFYETSAKNDDNIDKMFYKLAADIIARIDKGTVKKEREGPLMNISPSLPPKKSFCNIL